MRIAIAMPIVVSMSRPPDFRSEMQRVLCLPRCLEMTVYQPTIECLALRLRPSNSSRHVALESLKFAATARTPQKYGCQTPEGSLSWTIRLTRRALSGAALCSVCEGLSPNTLRYSTEKRPNSRKPQPVAISVTVTSLQSAAKSARLASDNRNIRRYRQGGRPRISLNALRSVRSLTLRARHRAEMWSGPSKSASASFSACSTRPQQDLLCRVEDISARVAVAH